MKYKRGAYQIFMSIIFTASLVLSYKGAHIYAKSPIDTSPLSHGIVKVSHKSSNRLKVMIQKDGKQYTYNLNNQGKVETFPLQLGNGKYTIKLYENTVGSKYRFLSGEEVTLNLKDSNQVYLNSVQNVHWDRSMNAIQYAAQKVNAGLSTELQKRSFFYKNIVQGYNYNYNKLASLPTTYLPVIDHTFKNKNGICYDFASLYASILRSMGIPTKLVKGYSANAVGYHAWNEVYNKSTGKWEIIDTTYDLQVVKQGKQVKSIKSSNEYQKINEY